MVNKFTDLIVWQKGHGLVLKIYSLTKTFPKSETYSLTDQLKRAAISITSNIAEGFSRHGFKEKIQFYYLSLGSLTEIQNQLIIARDVNYLTKVQFEELIYQTTEISKLLNGLIKSIKNRNA